MPNGDNVYLRLTAEFNAGRTRAIVSSGQAVVLHRLAFMSKDGDWILREDGESLERVLHVLAGHGARYRLGAPLDLRWMAGGWSAHFQFSEGPLRVRTDFVTRPPRLSPQQLAGIWAEQEGCDPPVVGLPALAELKKTDREKDYAVIGELARRMPDPGDQLRYSRSARDLLDLARRHPQLAAAVAAERPLLARAADGREALEAALDAERRALMHANERRLGAYRRAAAGWAAAWTALDREIAGLPLLEAHRIMASRAESLLPFAPPERPGADV
jgi:hypothetical protein